MNRNCIRQVKQSEVSDFIFFISLSRKTVSGSHWIVISLQFLWERTCNTLIWQTGMPNFQPNYNTRITFGRREIDEKFSGHPVQNRGRRIKRWRTYICFWTPSSGWNYFQSSFEGVKIANNMSTSRDRRKRQCNANRKPMSGYQLVTSDLIRRTT
jgi:hypothetical protein